KNIGIADMAQGATIHIHPAFFGPFSGLPRKGAVTNHVWRPHGRNDVDEVVVKIDWAVSGIKSGNATIQVNRRQLAAILRLDVSLFKQHPNLLMNNRDAE